MDVSIRRLQVVAVAALMAWSAASAAKPRVVVSTEFDLGAQAHLYRRIKDDLVGVGDQRTPEQFVTTQFIEVFSGLGMFEFKDASTATSEWVLTIKFESDSHAPWPLRDAHIAIRTSFPGPPIRIPFCGRADCGPASGCIPNSFADPTIYRDKFRALVAQWPTGFLKTIPLSTTASYVNGRIRVPQAISEFGQFDGQPPMAFYEVRFERRHHQFVFCRAYGPGTEGNDHGERAERNCSRRIRGTGSGQLGLVTLLRGFLE